MLTVLRNFHYIKLKIKMNSKPTIYSKKTDYDPNGRGLANTFARVLTSLRIPGLLP